MEANYFLSKNNLLYFWMILFFVKNKIISPNLRFAAEKVILQKVYNRGFTLIEILVAMGIFSMIFIFGLWIGLDFYERYNFDTESGNLISVLRKARNLSIGNFNESSHGVYIEQNRYTLYQGSSYAFRNQSFDEVFSPQRVNFSGLGEVNFSQLSGDANASGTIVASYKVKNKTIFINYEGKID